MWVLEKTNSLLKAVFRKNSTKKLKLTLKTSEAQHLMLGVFPKNYYVSSPGIIAVNKTVESMGKGREG